LKRKICIALSGRNRSGKDTAADYLIKKFKFKKYSFSDPIREFYNRALPNIDYHSDPEGRKIFIELAEAPKKIAPACWAYCLTEKIFADSFPSRIVIPDLRFRIESDHLESVIGFGDFDDYRLFKILILSKRSEEYYESLKNYKDKNLVDKLENDKSNNEHSIFDFDKVIENNEDENKFKQRLDDFILSIL
jgi:hypothetical protein